VGRGPQRFRHPGFFHQIRAGKHHDAAEHSGVIPFPYRFNFPKADRIKG
jgi:hypothetical protein